MTPTEARAIARSAYLFLYPLVSNYGAMYAEALDPTSPFFRGGFGQWNHSRVTTSRRTTVAEDDAATLRATTWLDVTSEPWTLSMQATEATRCRVVEAVDLWDFAIDQTGPDDHVGCRLLLASPAWTGDVPVDVDRVVHGESRFLRIETQMELDEPGDLDRVRTLQETMVLAPLSARPAEIPATASTISSWPYGEHVLTGLEFWSAANFVLSLTTPHDQDRMLLERVAQIGVVPGRRWDAASFPSEVREAIEDGTDDALTDLLRAVSGPGRRGRQSRDATDRDYFSRAVSVLAHARVAPASI